LVNTGKNADFCWLTNGLHSPY